MSHLAPRALYVHVPLCEARCAYCDFHSVARRTTHVDDQALVAGTLARARELASRFGASPDGEGRLFDTVYVGGGTPTALKPEAFRGLLSGLASLAPRPLEFTVEANPESLSAEALDAMRDAGVTRLSLGVQSLDEAALRVLGRRAGPEAIARALRLARASDLDLSADLIAGIPRRGGLAAEAALLLDNGVGHLSVYDLVLEEGTALARRVSRGEWAPQSEDEREDERAALERLLSARGFRRYEVSNYAPRGAESLHNLAYWRMDSYIGAGPGAVSTLAEEPASGGGSLRIEEGRALEGYGAGEAARAREEEIQPREAAFEAIMMAFRTSSGLDPDRFERRFGRRLESLVGKTLASWSGHLVPGEAEARELPGRRRLALDPSGLDLLNRFLTDCLAELETSWV